MSDPQPLLLFDIDGTLVVGDNAAHHAAIVAGLEDVFGLDLGGFSFMSLEPWGKTDLQIAMDALRAHGVTDPLARELLPIWLEVADRHHAAIIAAGAHPPPALAPNARETIADLGDQALIGLLTGNLEGIARRKLAAAGLEQIVTESPGGFGSDHAERGELVGIARRRAGNARPHPAADTIVIGDTPRDIACARFGGVTCIAVTTGPFDERALADADAVVSDLAQLAGALADLGFGVVAT